LKKSEDDKTVIVCFNLNKRCWLTINR